MIKAQQFVISLVKSADVSYDCIEEKSGVSKTTISRMMSGQTVSTSSLRLIADSFGKLDEFLGLISAAADPQRAADELHERFEHAERLLTESYEDRIRSLNSHIRALQATNEQLKNQHEKQIERMVAIHEKERAVDENHFAKEREDWHTSNQLGREELARMRKNNLYLVIGIFAEGILLFLALMILLIRVLKHV